MKIQKKLFLTDAIRHLIAAIPGSLLPSTDKQLGAGPAHWVAFSKSLEIAKMFANRGFDPNDRDSKGRSAITCFIGRRCSLETMIGILDIFLKLGLDLNQEYDPKTNIQPHIMSGMNRNYIILYK